MKRLKKKEYLPPRVDMTVIQMESGIAAGSGTVSPGSSNDEVSQEWDSNGSTGGDYDW